MRSGNRFQVQLSEFDLRDPEQKRDYNRRLFRAVARRYGAVTRLLSFGADPGWKRRLIQGLPAARSGAAFRALDLACGNGNITCLLAARYPRGAIVGLDLSPAMIARARRRLRAGRCGRTGRGGGAARLFAGLRPPPAGVAVPGTVRFELGDMGRLPYAAGSFDVVTGGYALRNAPELAGALREVWRVLKPGGAAAFLEFTRSPRPSVGRAQLRLLGLWGGIWGWLLHGNPEVYAYIADSLALFPDRERFEGLLRELGFRRVRSRLTPGGFVGLTFCQK